MRLHSWECTLYSNMAFGIAFPAVMIAWVVSMFEVSLGSQLIYAMSNVDRLLADVTSAMIIFAWVMLSCYPGSVSSLSHVTGVEAVLREDSIPSKN